MSPSHHIKDLNMKKHIMRQKHIHALQEMFYLLNHVVSTEMYSFMSFFKQYASMCISYVHVYVYKQTYLCFYV